MKNSNKTFRPAKCRQGFTFIEMIVALGVVGVVLVATFRLYIVQHSGFIIQEERTNLQQNARASIDALTRHIRMAGYDLPGGLDAIEAYDTNPDTIIVCYTSIDCQTFLSAPMPGPSSVLICGSDVSCFQLGQWVYITDPAGGNGEWMQISEVQVGTHQLRYSQMGLSKAYGADALVTVANRIKFFVDDTTDPEHPSLMLQLHGYPAQVFAEEINDLQFRYQMKTGDVEDEPILVQNIREVLIEITGQSHLLMEVGQDNGSLHEQSYSTSVYLRNVGA